MKPEELRKLIEAAEAEDMNAIRAAVRDVMEGK